MSLQTNDRSPLERLKEGVKDAVERIRKVILSVNVVEIPEIRRVQNVIQAKDIKHFDPKVQKLIGQLTAEREKLKADREKLLKMLYEDKVMNIQKDLNNQLNNIVNEIILEGEMHHMTGFPPAISYGDNKVIGRLLAVSHYNGQWYPVLWKDDGIRVILEGASSYGEVVRAKAGNFVIIGYNEKGKYVPKVYMQT